MQLDAFQIIRIMLRRWWIIFITAVICAIGAFMISKYMVQPKYSSYTTMYVYNRDGISQIASSSDIAVVKNLVGAYIQILKSRSVLSKVEANIQSGYTQDEILRMLKVNQVEDTPIIRVTVICNDPNDAYLIAEQIAEVSADEIVKIAKAGSVNILDAARVNPSKVSPNNGRNAILGFLIGALVSAAMIIMIELLDTRIKTEMDITDLVDIPVVGIIPNI